jgi:hypothetical protein
MKGRREVFPQGARAANGVTAVGGPPFSQALARVVEHKIPIFG